MRVITAILEGTQTLSRLMRFQYSRHCTKKKEVNKADRNYPTGKRTTWVVLLMLTVMIRGVDGMEMEIMTLNVGGLSCERGVGLTNYLNKNKEAIILLQETHFSEEEIPKFKKSMYGLFQVFAAQNNRISNVNNYLEKKMLNAFRNIDEQKKIYFDPDRALNTGGIAILVSRKWLNKANQLERSKDNRFIIIMVEVSEAQAIIIANVYGHSSNTRLKNKLLIRLGKKLRMHRDRLRAKYLNVITVIGGDFNIAPIPSMDSAGKTDGTMNPAIRRLLDECQLSDVFRMMHPYNKKFTYRGGQTNTRIQTRIDLLLSDAPQGCVKSANIDEFKEELSDRHSNVRMTLTNLEEEVCRRWMNDELKKNIHRPRFNTKNKKEALIRRGMEAAYDKCCIHKETLSVIEDIDVTYNEWLGSVQKCAELAFGKTEVGTIRKKAVDRKLKMIMEIRKKLHYIINNKGAETCKNVLNRPLGKLR